MNVKFELTELLKLFYIFNSCHKKKSLESLIALLIFTDYKRVVTHPGQWKKTLDKGLALEQRAEVEIRPDNIKISLRHLSSKWVVLMRKEKIHHTLLTFMEHANEVSSDVVLRVYSVRKDKLEVDHNNINIAPNKYLKKMGLEDSLHCL